MEIRRIAIRAQRQFIRVGRVFLFLCFLTATRELMCGLPKGQDAKTSKSPRQSAAQPPLKEFPFAIRLGELRGIVFIAGFAGIQFLFLFLPPLIFCSQKQKENHNAKRIKNLQNFAQKSLHPNFRLTLGLFSTSL